MDNFEKFKIIGRIVLFIIAIIFGLRFLFKKEQIPTYYNDYLPITDSIEIHDVVSRIDCPPTIRCVGGGTYIVMKSKDRFNIQTKYNDSTTLWLTEILEAGDSISKTANVDSVSIIKLKDRLMYQFALGITR